MNAFSWTAGAPDQDAPTVSGLVLSQVPQVPLRSRYRQRQLFTATLRIERGEFEILVFHASHAADCEEVYGEVAARAPGEYLGHLTIREGIDVENEVVMRLVSKSLRDQLAAIGDCCPVRRPLHAGGVLHIFQRGDVERSKDAAGGGEGFVEIAQEGR